MEETIMQYLTQFYATYMVAGPYKDDSVLECSPEQDLAPKYRRLQRKLVRRVKGDLRTIRGYKGRAFKRRKSGRFTAKRYELPNELTPRQIQQSWEQYYAAQFAPLTAEESYSLCLGDNA